MNDIDLSVMAEKWPSAIVSRDNIAEFTGGLLTRKTMSNTDQGLKRYRHGRKIFYKVDDLIVWIARRSEEVVVDDYMTAEELLLEQELKKNEKRGPSRSR